MRLIGLEEHVLMYTFDHFYYRLCTRSTTLSILSGRYAEQAAGDAARRRLRREVVNMPLSSKGTL